MTLEREISINFISGSYQSFENVETDCTDLQITTFAEACGSIVGSAVGEVEIDDVTTITFGSGE